MSWWLLPIPIIIVLVWAGWYVFAFVLDLRRTDAMRTDPERLDVHPHGPTSIPREQQDRHDGPGSVA